MYLLSFFTTLLLLNFSSVGAQEVPTGCLVRAEKSIIIDINCVCTKTNSCMKFEKLKADREFFEAKNNDGKPLFSQNEKSLYSQSYEHFNAIMEMKANGLAKSDAVKEKYLLLEQTNQSLRKSLVKNNPTYFAKTKKAFLAKQDAAKKNRRAWQKGLISILNAETLPAIAETAPERKDKTIENSVPMAKKTNLPKEVITVSPAPASVKNREEEEYMLKQVDREKYDIQEEDSLFDIITKTYKKRAYKELLAP